MTKKKTSDSRPRVVDIFGPAEHVVLAHWLEQRSPDETKVLSLEWWKSARDEHIRAAIDISGKYFEQSKGGIAYVVTEHGAGLALTNDWAEVSGWLDYISYLANQGMVDKSYLSPSVLCDIKYLADGKFPPSETNDLAVRKDYIEEKKFVNSYPADSYSKACDSAVYK
jgi:hypothetical protein